MSTRKAQIQIHFCVVLWGFTGILGKLISLPALPLVWWRMIMVTAVLALFPRVRRGCQSMSGRLIAAYAGVGFLIALHWLTFYASIKLANASVGATCMALAPVFLAVIEPLIVGRRLDPRELLLGAAMVPGVMLVVGGTPTGMRLGILVGIISALFVAAFGTLNKRLVEHGDPFAITAIELGAGAGLVTLLAPLLPHAGSAFPIPSARDALLLLILAVGCTLIPFTLSLVALRNLTAFGAQLAVNLEPLYTIIIAIVVFGEHHELGPRFYFGVAIILGIVMIYPLIARRPVAIIHSEELAAVEAGEKS